MPPKKNPFICCFRPTNTDDKNAGPSGPRSRPSGSGAGSVPFGSGSGGETYFSMEDPLLWSRDLEKHIMGEFSFAVVQGNGQLEDYSQVETCNNATFVGVYDGHGGRDVSRFISIQLFLSIMYHAAGDSKNITRSVLGKAIADTEGKYLRYVSQTFKENPAFATIGSCCLAGVISKTGSLYIANLGDSRAVMGCTGSSAEIKAEQLTYDHNVNREEVRTPILATHQYYDPDVVVQKNGVWRIKGILQVSRAIGDAYMKSLRYAVGPSTNPGYQFNYPIQGPVISAEPEFYSRALKPDDRFLILASDGLWHFLTNQEVVNIVHSNPRRAIAKRLIEMAQKEAARRREIQFQDLQKIYMGERRKYHDDITVVVIFIDILESGLLVPVPELSFRGFVDTDAPSLFNKSYQELKAQAEAQAKAQDAAQAQSRARAQVQSRARVRAQDQAEVKASTSGT